MATSSACLFFHRRVATAAAAASRLHLSEVRAHRLEVFSREQSRQRALFPRVEKIEVSVSGPGLDGTVLIMNRGRSTAMHCARHLTEHHVNSSVVALVDGEVFPLHKPLTDSCSLRLLTFTDNDPTLVNQVFWRSCSVILGHVLETSFKDDFSVELLPTQETPVTSGSFICDFVLDPKLDSWSPSEETLRSLTRGTLQLLHQDLPFEPLDVTPSVALEVFTHSRCQQEEVEKLASENPKGTVTLYRCGDHVCVSRLPLVARTGLCGQFEVTALHTLGNSPLGLKRRVQGLSLPGLLQAHHTVWRKLRKRAEKLVELPGSDLTPPTPAQ